MSNTRSHRNSEIRKQDKYKDLPIIAMTANVMAGDREKVLKAGMNDHIGKPINVKEMFSVMAKWITPSEPFQETTLIQHENKDDNDDAITFPDLPGINIEAGLKTAQGNSKLYLKLLLKFKNTQQDFKSIFNQALESDDETEAERTAHTLKGVAGNIGAQGVMEAATKLEQACKDNIQDYSELLGAVISELSVVMEGLNQLEQHSNTIQTAKEIDMDAVNGLMDRLKSLLEEDDTDAVEVLEEILELITGHPESKKFKEINTAIENYDFDDALELFGKINYRSLDEM